MDYFKLSNKLKDSILNPNWAPPAHARSIKGGKEGTGIWDEVVIIEDFVHEKDENTKDEQVRIRVRVSGESETENRGRSHTERMGFPAEALHENAAPGKVMQFSISYKNLIAAYHAAGNEGAPDPGEIDPDSMRGTLVEVTVKVAPDKRDGTLRQNIVGWRPPQQG